jgi:hypothetical protein
MSRFSGRNAGEKAELGFTYEMLQYYTPETIEEYLTKFQIIKVPTSMGTKAFFHYKKYPKDFLQAMGKKSGVGDSKKSLYQVLGETIGKQSSSVGMVNLNQKLVRPDTKSAQMKGPSITVKTFANPMLQGPGDSRTEKEKYDDTSAKIAGELPDNRTALIINFDKLYPEEFVRRVFGVMGQVRRVFGGSIGKKAGEIKNRALHYHVVVFKHEKDMLRAFDLHLFQRRILEVMYPAFRGQSAMDQKQIFNDYLAALDIGYEEAENIMLEDADGYISAQYGFSKIEDPDAPKTLIDEVNEECKRKRKKLPEFKDDFYKFQLRAKKARQDVEIVGKRKSRVDRSNSDEEDDQGEGEDDDWESLDLDRGDEKPMNESNMLDADYLAKKKQELASSFQKQLEGLRRKKLKTA